MIDSLRLQHVDHVFRLGDEVRLVFKVIGALPIENWNLPFGRLEPLDGVAFQNDRELTLGVRVELLYGVSSRAFSGIVADTSIDTRLDALSLIVHFPSNP